MYETDSSYYERQLISTKQSYLIVIKFVLLSLIKSVHYQTYVKYQIKSPCKISNVLMDLKYPPHLILANNKPKGNTSTKLDDKYTENLQSSIVYLGTLSCI